MPISSIFSKDKLVNNSFLNYIGIQPIRILLAETLCKLRANHFNNLLEDDIIKLRREGLVIKNNFLSIEEFNSLKEEVLNFIKLSNNPTYTKRFGPNTVNTWDISKFSSETLLNINKYFNNNNLLSLLEAGERRKIKKKNILCQIEVLTQGKENGEIDGETALHADTFYNTYKAWLYLTDITPDNGPFTYIRKTNKITLNRLKADYKNSIAKDKTGSRRITQEELEKDSLKETIVVCNANTLVVANTFGYHRRLRGTSGNTRIALSCSVRFHPFDIFS